MYKWIWQFITGQGRPAPPEPRKRRAPVADGTLDAPLVIHVPPVFAQRLRDAAEAQGFSSLSSWALAVLVDHVGQVERKQHQPQEAPAERQPTA
jgi:hypothetical protein